ncbi:YfbU family protein [Atlantibacter hermannii]|uniref:YfbU family protein n=1 Tax=Atlantibacter hermannii TaxID=565 RepID=UPI002FE13368
MSYTQAEKLQILLLCDIHEALGIKNSFDADIIREAVSTNNTWAIEWEASSLSTEEDTPEDVSFVCDVLDMYDFLKFTYDNLTEEDKKKLTEEVKHFNGEDSVTFPGFDGNNESRLMSIAYMLKKLNRFNRQDITKNSHMPTIAIYRRMLEVFYDARKDMAPGKGISYEALRDTLRARTHPEYR